MREVKQDNFNPDYSRQRETGGGRKKKEVAAPELTEWVLEFTESHSAGSPTDPSIKWTCLRPCEIAQHIESIHGGKVSNSQIKRIPKSAGYRKRKPAKALPTGHSQHRNEQFRLIVLITSLCMVSAIMPVISIDTK